MKIRKFQNNVRLAITSLSVSGADFYKILGFTVFSIHQNEKFALPFSLCNQRNL